MRAHCNVDRCMRIFSQSYYYYYYSDHFVSAITGVEVVDVFYKLVIM